MPNLASRIAALEREQPPAVDGPVDKVAFDWYATSCPCKLPLGECKQHPRARPSQRPPEGEWTKLLQLAGRGFGKTRSGAQWVRSVAESGEAKRIALVAPTAADVRDVMVEGESGILAVSPPWFTPQYYPSKRKLVWPNGCVALMFSSEKPNRLRGPQFTHAWVDEPAAMDYAQQTYDMLLFGLRLGTSPKLFMTTTPRATPFIKALVADPAIKIKKGSTYENRSNLAPSFFSEIVSRYEGTRLGRQEIEAELLEVGESAWFTHFEDSRNVTELAEFREGEPVYIAADVGVSRYTGAIWFQSRQRDEYRQVVTVFADYMSLDLTSRENAEAIRELGDTLPCRGVYDGIKLDPAATARTGIGMAAYGEYEAVFGARFVDKWPQHRVIDGLDQLELLVGTPKRTSDLYIHPRAKHLIEAMKTYRHDERRGEILDGPAPVQHPSEDLCDALRGAVRFLMPEGHRPKPHFDWVPFKKVF